MTLAVTLKGNMFFNEKLDRCLMLGNQMYQILLVKFSHVLKYEVVNDKHSYEPRAIGQRVCIEEDEF